jgi:hypothetical protein
MISQGGVMRQDLELPRACSPSSLKIFSHPSRFKAASCRARDWSSVETRAYPYFMPRIMGQQNGTAQALFLQGFDSRPETYPL